MKQGTISVLYGCHSPIHSVLVFLSWKKLHGSFPQPWEAICILIHDIGHWGTNYLDNLDEKKAHWRLGAVLAKRLFGQKGYDLIAGHCEYSGVPQSKLYRPDKYSWYLAPRFWIYWNDIAEPKIRHGLPRKESVDRFKAQIKHNIESGNYHSNHQMYLDRIEGKDVRHD